MPKHLQDKQISAYEYTKYNVAYPIIITRWEIKKVHGIDKRYLQIYFRKIDKDILDFKFSLKYINASGAQTEEHIVNNVNDKKSEFFEIVPLNSQVNSVEVTILQCSLLDATVLKPNKSIIIDNKILFLIRDLPFDMINEEYIQKAKDKQEKRNMNEYKREIIVESCLAGGIVFLIGVIALIIGLR